MTVKRIVLWAVCGVLVACGWTTYALGTAPYDYEVQLGLLDRALQILAYATCPVLIAGPYFAWVIPLNGATYAVLGLVIEGWLRKSNRLTSH